MFFNGTLVSFFHWACATPTSGTAIVRTRSARMPWSKEHKQQRRSSIAARSSVRRTSSTCGSTSASSGAGDSGCWRSLAAGDQTPQVAPRVSCDRSAHIPGSAPSHAVCSCKQRSKQQWRQRKAHAAAQATAPQCRIDASIDSSSSVFVCMFRSLFVFCSACSTCMRTVSFFRCLRCRILIHWQISQGAGSPYLTGNVTRASEHFAGMHAHRRCQRTHPARQGRPARPTVGPAPRPRRLTVPPRRHDLPR